MKAPSPCAESWYTGASGRNVPRFFGSALNYICLRRTFRAFRSYDCQTQNVFGRWKEYYRARILEVRQELIAKGYEGNCIQIKERLQHPTTFSIMVLAELAKYCEKRQAEVGVRITQLTANKYHRVLRYLKEYVAAHYKKNVVTYRPICGYIFQSVWQCQLVDNRVIIKRFLSASADSKVCIELLDTFRVIPENLALREKNRTAEVGAFDRRRTANESKSDNSGVSTAIHANSDYKRKTECP
ncbi:hypothetical protein [uncultured Alistipes sp.]|uniref:hypothetical protein n=1 Tax=uncultured Alistipes sp. TaxID=538949 RepID=UPI00272C8389|nr:hypothetical protein [uncultured Alistipes sp.]